MKEVKKYTIGDMAKLCGISPRQLRYYDQRGLIRPSYKNPETGYRYYTEDQIEAVFYINELKNTGISNDSIQRLCEKRNIDQLVQELQSNLVMVENEIMESLDRYRKIVNSLVVNTRALAYFHGQEAIDCHDYPRFWIDITRVPNSKILYIKSNNTTNFEDRSRYAEHIANLTVLGNSLHAKLDNLKILIRKHTSIEALGRAETVVGEEDYLARIILEGDDISDANIVDNYGGWNAVTTISIGDRTSLTKAYKTLLRWASDHDIKVSDMAIEEYLVDTFSSTNESEFVTRILIPILE